MDELGAIRPRNIRPVGRHIRTIREQGRDFGPDVGARSIRNLKLPSPYWLKVVSAYNFFQGKQTESPSPGAVHPQPGPKKEPQFTDLIGSNTAP